MKLPAFLDLLKRTAKATHGHPSRNVAFAWKEEDLQYLPSTGPVVLAGDLAGVSLNAADGEAFPNYIQQQDLMLPSTQRLRAWVHPQVVSNKPLAKRATLMADQMAEYVVTQKTDTVLLGGVFGEQETTLILAVSVNGRLDSLEERVLPGTDAPRFQVDFDDLIDKLNRKYVDHQRLLCYPVDPDLVSGKWEHIGDKPFRLRRQRPLGGITEGINLAPYLLPLAAQVAILAGLALLLKPHYDAYERARTAFARESAVVTGGAEYAPTEVDLLTRRKLFLDNTAKQATPLRQAPDLAVALATAIPTGSRVLEMTVRTRPPKPSENQTVIPADLSAVVMIEADPKLSALDQAQPILSRIAATTKMRGRLAPNGWRDDKTREAGKDRAWRVYTIEAVKLPEGQRP